jgi:2-polyprenyl-3-methyl-5-hydroxy-6-metoxy-1,4-benzoquinol methylase
MAEKLELSKLQIPGVTEKFAVQMVNDLKKFWDSNGSLDPQKVDKVNCTLCGTACPEEILFSRIRFPYRRCPECSLVYASPRPKSALVMEQYVTGRFASMFHEFYLPSAEYRMATIFKERVEELIMPRVPKGRLLDVGSGSGHFLKVAADHGFEVHGVEPNPDMKVFATEKLGLPNIQCGTLSSVQYPSDHFDIITLWDVLEHVEDPHSILVEVMRILKPGGWVFAYTENFDSFNVCMTKEYSEMVAADVHLRHYSPKTFRREFEKAKFQVDKVYTKGLDLAHIRKTFATHPEVFPQTSPWPLTPEQEEIFQDFVNQYDKGDNLRLFARKKK